MGCEHIAEKVLGADYSKGDNHDVCSTLEKIRARLEQYMEFCSQMKPDKVAIHKKELAKNRYNRIDSSLDISTKAFIASCNADRDLDPSTPQFSVTPYNVRIKTQFEMNLMEAMDMKSEANKAVKVTKEYVYFMDGELASHN